MSVIQTLRDAIRRGSSCPVTPKVTMTVEQAQALEAELIRLNASQANDAIMRAQFELEC
jgi:hypothetical protein